MDFATVEKSKLSWETRKMNELGVTAKTLLIRIPRLPDIICLFICNLRRDEADIEEYSLVQSFSYELTWEDIQNMPIFYTCEAVVYSSIQKKIVWTDKKTGVDGAFLSSTDIAPKGEGWTDGSSGTLRFDLVITFDLIRSSALFIPTVMSEITHPLLKEGMFSDVVVYCGGKTFNCHKAILAGHSDVFKAMVTAPFKEAMENRIELKDMTADVAELIIKFVYGFEVPKDSVTWALFEAAKMFDLPKLMCFCVTNLGNTLNNNNACEMLYQAHKHSLENLFNYIFEYVKRNKAEVAMTEGWKDVTGDNDFINKVLLAALK